MDVLPWRALAAKWSGRPRLLIATWLVLVYTLRRWLQHRKFARLPVAPCVGFHWILGHFGHVILRCPRVPRTTRPDLMPLWVQASEETRKEGLFYMSFFHWLVPLWRNMVIVHDVDLVKKVLSKDSWGLYRKGRAYTIAMDLIGFHSLLAEPDSELWRRQRRIFSAAFRRHLFDRVLAPSVREAVAAMTSRWEQGRTVQFYDDALELTIGVLGRFAFGTDFEGPRLRQAFAVVLQTMTTFGRNPLLFHLRRLPTSRNRRYWAALGDIEEAVQRCIERRTEGEGGGDDGDDLVSQVLKVAEKEGGSLGSRLVRENLQTFLFAGHDTTASALSWAVRLLAEHPTVEARLLEEFRGLGQAEPMCDDLDRLPYLEAVVRETLRLYPSAGFTREPLADIELGKHVLPRGVEVFIFPYLTHRNEKVFSDFARFDPERWLGPQSAAPESMGWMPFSLGARNCIGSQLAKLEIKLTLYHLLTRYSFSIPEDPDGLPRPVLYMTLVPNAVPLIPSLRDAAPGASG